VRKDELAIQGSLYALNGIMGNPVNLGRSVSSLVEQSINLGVALADRWAQITTLDSEVVQQYVVAALPATPAINYTSTPSSTVNNPQTTQVVSTAPTTVTDPSGNPISGVGTKSL